MTTGRAAAEVGIIVTGILLAFGVDAAWESWQERRQEREYMAALQGELESALLLIPESDSVNSAVQHAHEALIIEFGKASHAPPDSLFLWMSQLSRPVAFDPPRAVLDDLVSSGGIQLVADDRLRLSVAEYGRRLVLVERTSDQAWATWAERIQPYLESRVSRVERLRRGSYAIVAQIPFDPSPFSPDFDSLFQDPAFESMLAERWIRLDSGAGMIEDIREVMEEIVSLINDQFGPS